MFLGEYQHSLDAKGRVILPARFRDQLEGGAVMARALDGCLAVYPVDEFDRLATRIREVRERGGEQRQAARTFFAGAVEIAPDKQGRVAVPQHLRDVRRPRPRGDRRRQLRPHRDLGRATVPRARPRRDRGTRRRRRASTDFV